MASTTVLAVACLGAFLAFLDATVVNVAFPSIREHFGGASISELSWVLNAYNIVLAATLVVFGSLADLAGRRRLFSAGVGLFVVASVACALAPDVVWLVAFRGVQALGAAMLVPASLALVIEAFPAARRAHAVGLWGATAAAAAGLGPPIGGALVRWGDWRWAFLVNVPVGVVAVLASQRLLVESRTPGRRRLPDVRGASLVAAALGLVTTAIVTGGDWGWTSPRVLGCIVLSVGAGAGFVASSRRHPRPLVPRQLLRVRTFVVANAASTVAGLGFYAYLLTNVLWLQYVWGYDVLEAGLALVPAALVAAVTAALLGPVAERHGYVVVAVPGAVVWALAYVWYATTVGTSPAFLSQWLPGQLLSGVGVGATMPILGSASLASVPGGRYALASAVNSSVRQVGGVLGVALLVVLIGSPDAAGAADALRRGWLFSAACFLGCALVAAFTGRPDLGRSEVSDTGAAAETRILGPTADLVRPEPTEAEGASLMAQLTVDARDSLRASSERVVLPAGEVLFRAGDPADGAYAVVSGRVDVVTPDGGVRGLGAGGVIGELALLTGGTRSATVVARRDSVLERVSAPALHSLLDRDPTAARSLATVLAGQLARPPRHDRQPEPVTVAVVALHRGARAEAVAHALADGMSRWLRVATPSGAIDAAALERAERGHDRVLLVAADPVGDRAWWATALRQADAVVAVAAAETAVPEESRIPPGADLVLVGHGVEADRARWSAALQAWQVTSVDRPDAASLQGLSARLAGRSLGLVLGGGGARAFAHIGVLMALEEAHVRVDRVAGTSVGGIIAGLHAMGWAAGEVRERAYAEFVRGRPFSDYTVPRSALAKGQRMRRALTRHFAEARIEGMPRQFRCVSTDLLARVPVVHRRGELVPALMATAALPGLLPPVRLDGRLHVDGGVLDNLPVGALSERSEGPVVAVNIGMGGGAGGSTERSKAPRPVRTPALGETLLRTMLIGSGGAVQAAHTAGALVLTPSTMGAGLLEFHQFDAVVEAGLAAGRRLVEEGAELLSGSAGP